MRVFGQIFQTQRSAGMPFLARYAVAGGGAALVYIAVYYALAGMAEAPSLPSSCVAYCVSLVVQYIAHARFSFGAEAANLRQGARFACATAVGLAASSTIAFMGPRLGWPPLATAGAVVIVVPPLNLLLLAGWVFAGRAAKGGAPGD